MHLTPVPALSWLFLRCEASVCPQTGSPLRWHSPRRSPAHTQPLMTSAPSHDQRAHPRLAHRLAVPPPFLLRPNLGCWAELTNLPCSLSKAAQCVGTRGHGSPKVTSLSAAHQGGCARRQLPPRRRSSRSHFGGGGNVMFRKWIGVGPYLMFIVFKKHSKDIYPNDVIKTTFSAVRFTHRLFSFLPSSGQREY